MAGPAVTGGVYASGVRYPYPVARPFGFDTPHRGVAAGEDNTRGTVDEVDVVGRSGWQNDTTHATVTESTTVIATTT